MGLKACANTAWFHFSFEAESLIESVSYPLPRLRGLEFISLYSFLHLPVLGLQAHTTTIYAFPWDSNLGPLLCVAKALPIDLISLAPKNCNIPNNASSVLVTVLLLGEDTLIKATLIKESV